MCHSFLIFFLIPGFHNPTLRSHSRNTTWISSRDGLIIYLISTSISRYLSTNYASEQLKSLEFIQISCRLKFYLLRRMTLLFKSTPASGMLVPCSLYYSVFIVPTSKGSGNFYRMYLSSESFALDALSAQAIYIGHFMTKLYHCRNLLLTRNLISWYMTLCTKLAFLGGKCKCSSSVMYSCGSLTSLLQASIIEWFVGNVCVHICHEPNRTCIISSSRLCFLQCIHCKKHAHAHQWCC